MVNFSPPGNWRRFLSIDAHTAGEPLRVVVDGWPPIPGNTMLDRRRFAREFHDDLRRALMFEPRGHADMYGCLLTPPATADGDVGVLFMHNEGFSTMCGHGIIGLVKVGIDCALFPERILADAAAHTVVRIDTPAGRVLARATRGDGGVASVRFENVPSFLLERDLVVQVAGVPGCGGRICCDIAFGGAFYAVVAAADVGLDLVPANHARLVDAGRRIKRAVTEQFDIHHPDGDPDLEFLYGTIFVAEGGAGVHSRNVCVFADGEVDRSPTGTGVSARAAIHHARGELAEDSWITIESLIGTRFDVRVVRPTRVGVVDAAVPEVRGQAHITGQHEFFIDPEDPVPAGFLVR